MRLRRFQFEHGPVHFIYYSTEHEFGKGSAQHKWLKGALAAVDRRRTPWLIVGGHRPIYVDSTENEGANGHAAVAADLRDALEEAMRDARVDLTLQGHHHSYQRTCHVYRGDCVGHDDEGVPEAPIHIVIGNAGASLTRHVQTHVPKVRAGRAACQPGRRH